GGIGLNRPEVLNAMGRDWPDDMLAAAREMQDDRAIRVVLVTGEGRAFCSGLDLTHLAAGEIPNPWFHQAELAYRALETLDKPVIAGVQGHCIGGGLQIVIACDVRIAADDAILGLPATTEACLPGMGRYPLPPLISAGGAAPFVLSGGTVGAGEAYSSGLGTAAGCARAGPRATTASRIPAIGTYRLRRVIGTGWARHPILSGETVGAEEAYRIGLVKRVVPRRKASFVAGSPRMASSAAMRTS